MRRALQLASLACLAMLCLFYPVVESLDAMDSPVPAADFEIEIIVLLTFIGIVFLLTQLLASVTIGIVRDVLRYLLACVTAPVQMLDFSFHPLQNPSPPLPLRI